MQLLRLRLEGHQDIPLATSSQVEQAILKMTEPDGPTYVVLNKPEGGYAQAAGFDDRYRIELRDDYGEGFRHWLAASPTRKDRSDVVMYYRNRCDIHGRRKCPLPAWGENVLALTDVLTILLYYHATGERIGTYPWEDVSASFLEEASHKIKTIKPKKTS